MKGLLDNPPTFRHAEKRENIRHANAGTCQLTRPVGDLDPNDRYGFHDVHAYHPRFNIWSWPVLIDPIEEEVGSDSKLLAGIAKERCIGMERRAHEFAVALSAAIDVKLKGLHHFVVSR